MKNPKTWTATSYDHHGLNDHSSSGRSEGKSMNSRGHAHPTRSEKMTPVKHFSATPDSEAWSAIPGSTNTHPMLMAKEEMNSGHVGDGKMKHAPVSGNLTFRNDPVNHQAKGWKSRGYDMAGGHGVASESAGMARKKPR